MSFNVLLVSEFGWLKQKVVSPEIVVDDHWCVRLTLLRAAW
jgi:hypothetical protein